MLTSTIFQNNSGDLPSVKSLKPDCSTAPFGIRVIGIGCRDLLPRAFPMQK